MRLAVEILIFLMQIMVLGALFYRLRHTGQPWSIISPFLVLILLMVPVQGIELVELVSHPDTWNLLPTWHDLYIFLASLLLLLALTGVSPLTRRLWESDGHLAESSRQLVTVLESISDGISLVGPDMKLRACNTSAQKILGLPNRLTRLGTPGEAIFRYNAERGEYGPGDVDLLVQERMERSLQFVPHQFERTRPDGTVIEVTGKPVPGGGFITTYRDVTAQRQAERALRDNQRLLQQILDTLPSPINLKDKDLRFLVANQAVIHDSGMSREALIGMRLSETHILSKQAAEELEQTDAAVLRTGERMELPIVPRTLSSGKQVVEQVIKVPFRNEREEVVGVVTVVMDITQRYQAEEELRRSQSLLSQIMETLPSPISLKDSELRLQMVNKAVSDTRGRSKEDLIGMRLSETDLHSKNISLELEATDREVLRTGERREIPSVIRTLHDGRQVVDHLIKVPFRDENGNPVGVLTVGQDVTARVAAEQALQRQQRWLSQILDKLPMPISLKDTAGRFVMINETYARVTNRRKEALLGKRIEDIEYLSEQETNPIDQGDRQVLATGKRVEIFPHHMKRHDGKDQVVHIIKVPFLDEQNTITGVLTVVLDVTHRYKAEQEVRRQEHLLTQVMDTLPSPLSLKDREGHYQMVNQAILELTGQSRAEVLGKTVDQIPFRSADQIELLKAKDQQVLSTGARQELFAQRTNPDGGGLVIEHMIKVPFRDERGKIIGVLTMAQDVTARVQAEEELRQSRNMLTQIMDTMPSPLSLKDRHGHYLMVNQVIAAATGKSKEELVGADMNILQLRPQEEIKRLKEMDDQVLESGTRQERQSLRYDRINGHTIIEQVTKVPFRDARGSIIGVLTMAQDITDRFEAEKQMRESQRVLNAILDTLPSPVALKDRELRYLVVNQAMGDTFGLPKEELLGKTIFEMPGQSEEKIRRIHEGDLQVLKTGEPQSLENIFSHFKNGHTRVEHVIKVPFRNPAGEIDGVVLVAQDVTASYNTERALRRQATSLAGLVRRLSTREGEAESWFNEITREGCKTLGVSRCGIWMFTPGRVQLDPMSLFNAATETYVPGQSLRSKEFPRYFHALYQEGPLVIDNALVDPRASELFKAYLNPLGITSLLVAPIWVEGEMAGVVGLEHIGPPRHWSLEDQIYTVSLADAIAMVVSAFRRREAEARRQASESRFQALIEQSVQGMILHRNWDIVYANQAAADILGFDSVEDLLNRKDIGTLIAPEYMDRVRIHPAKPGAKSGWEYLSPAFKLNEIESLKKDGERVWTSNISQLLDWEGRTTVLTIFSDISEQKRIQAQLESSEQRFRFLIEKSVQGILLHRKRSLIFVNSSAATILGYDSAEELLSQRDLESIIDPADREKVRKLALARERGEAVPPYYEIRALKKNGELVWVSILGQVMEWEGAPAIFVIFNDISVQKHIQEQLRSSEQRFRHLTEHSLQGVFVHNNAIVEFANQAAADLLGFESLELLIGRNPILLLLPQDQQIMQERAQLRMAGEPVPNEYDIRMLRQDGMVIWVHMRNQLVDWDGKKSIVTVFNDISEQKHVQELLSSSEKRFRSLTEHSIQGVLVHQDGRVVLGNKTAANLLGFETPEDLVSKNSTDFFLPEDHSAIEERRRKRLAGEPVANQYDIRMVKKDGTAFWVHSLNHLVDWDGTPAIVMLFNDISEQKRIQTELLASQHRYRTLFEGSIQGVLVHNGLKPLYVNPAGARIFGFVSPEEVMALSSLSHMVNAEDLKWAWDEWQRQKMLGKQINFIHTVRGLRSRGGEVQVEAFSTEVVWEGRVAMQVTFVDVTEKLRLEEQLRQAQKMEAVGQLAGGVAHDINNTLQVLQMTLEMVTQYKSLPESMGKYVTGGLRAIQNSSNLVRQLLTFGRRHTLDMKDLDLNAAVRNHSEMFSRLLGSRIELNVKMPPETILVHADDGMLGQMLLNLMVNARDAMPNGGSITLSTASFIPDDSFLVEHPTALRKPYGRISVTDTGTGMSEEVRARIFEPFFTTKPIGRGTGLGLAMVYGLVKSHTGFISVSSTVGHGTTFHIFFPVVTPQGSPTTPVPVPAPSTPSPAGRGTLLVAEDQADLRAFIIDLLESEGYQVLPAANGEEALVLLRDNLDTIKLALLDMVMPRLGGLEVCREIRSRCPGIPVIFLTGHIPDDMSQALEDEIRAPILKKPISADDLVAIISRTLSSR